MKKVLTSIAFLILLAATAAAQTNDFTYQGSLNLSGTQANGTYDFEFRLFDAADGGAQVGTTATRAGVTVTNGVFSVSLSFAGAFPGADRWMEIAVRQAGSGGGYQQLLPRVKVNSSPYAIRSQSADTAANAVNATNASNATNAATATNALNFGGVPASQYVQTTDPRMTDARTPTAGSTNYIQNTNTQQAASNFSISGNGTAGGTLLGNIVSSTSGFYIGPDRAFHVPASGNVYGGIGSGAAVTTGKWNTFIGQAAGGATTTGEENSYFGFNSGGGNGSRNSFFGHFTGRVNTANDNAFFGSYAGAGNSSGSNNSFFGANSGIANTTGSSNSFFGKGSGAANTTGDSNSFFGTNAGSANTIGSYSTFVGTNSGRLSTTGMANSFFGYDSGRVNTSGYGNTFVGTSAGQSNTTGVGNSYFGDQVAFRSNGNSNAFFGRYAGNESTTASQNAFFGSNAGMLNTTGGENTFIGFRAGVSTSTGIKNAFVGASAGESNNGGTNNTAIGAEADMGAPTLTFATAIGSLAVVSTSNSIVLGRPGGEDTVRIPGKLNLTGNATMNGNLVVATGGLTALNGSVLIPSLGSAGSTSLCRNASNFLATCSSSLRYKTNIRNFSSGLDLVKRLQPITFDWKQGGMHDLGLGAEDVAAVEPLLASYNEKGEVEGVKYDRIGVVLLNAVKEQQEQIEAYKRQLNSQQQQIDRQSEELAAIKLALCKLTRPAEACK